MNSAPGLAAGRMSLQAAMTWRPAGSMVMTTSAPATASRAEPAMATPVAAASLRSFSTRSKPIDAMARLDEIGGHRAAHIAEADKGDRAHGFLRKF